MNTEKSPKAPTIYGTVTFDQFTEAAKTVEKYISGLAIAYANKELLAEEHKDKLTADLLMSGIVMMSVNTTHGQLVDAMKQLGEELNARKGNTETKPRSSHLIEPEAQIKPERCETFEPLEIKEAQDECKPYDPYKPETI